MAASLKLVEGKKVDADRQKALDAALSQIDRAFGKGSAMKLGQKRLLFFISNPQVYILQMVHKFCYIRCMNIFRLVLRHSPVRTKNRIFGLNDR